jgi:hypothetical protein
LGAVAVVALTASAASACGGGSGGEEGGGPAPDGGADDGGGATLADGGAPDGGAEGGKVCTPLAQIPGPPRVDLPAVCSATSSCGGAIDGTSWRYSVVCTPRDVLFRR